MARWRSPENITLAHRLEALGIRLGVALFSALPHRAALRAGAALGSLAYRLGIRRRVTQENLRLADAGVAEEAVPHVAHEVYRSLGRTLAEYARLPRMGRDGLRDRVHFQGLEHMRAALAQGKGVIAVSGHFGSLELMATSFTLIDVRPTLLVAPMRNPLATRFFRAHRSAYGVEVAEVGPRLREAFRVLRGGGLLCLAADQDAGRHGMFVDFLGRPASTPMGAVELAARTGAPIVFGLCFREGLEHHRVEIRPPFTVPAESRGEDLRAPLQQLTTWLGEGVRRQPDHWFWLHRRWKTQPVAAEGALDVSAPTRR